jgi:hypothetical protein
MNHHNLLPVQQKSHLAILAADDSLANPLGEGEHDPPWRLTPPPSSVSDMGKKKKGSQPRCPTHNWVLKQTVSAAEAEHYVRNHKALHLCASCLAFFQRRAMDLSS